MSGYPCCGGQTDIGHMLDCAAHRQANAAHRQARAVEQIAEKAVDQTKLLSASQLAIRDLLDAIKEFHPGDLLEGCTNVKQTYAGDYDCEGCRSCGLYYETVAAERMIERLDEVLHPDASRSRSDVPIGEA